MDNPAGNAPGTSPLPQLLLPPTRPALSQGLALLRQSLETGWRKSKQLLKPFIILDVHFPGGEPGSDGDRGQWWWLPATSFGRRGLTSACVSGAGQKQALRALGTPCAELLAQGSVTVVGWKSLHRRVCTEVAPCSQQPSVGGRWCVPGSQPAGGSCRRSGRSDLTLLPWSRPAETSLWFLLLGCVSAVPVCWAGWGGQSGAAAGEADQGRFLLHLSHRRANMTPYSVSSLSLCAAACLPTSWGAQRLNPVQQSGADREGSPGSALLCPEREALQKRGRWWPGAGEQRGQRVMKRGGVQSIPGRGRPRGTPKLA